ncbi:GAF domain-containing protein [Chloroflexota bacterium]
MPIFEDEKIVAVIGVGNKPQQYNDADVQQIALFASNMWDIFQRQQAE